MPRSKLREVKTATGAGYPADLRPKPEPFNFTASTPSTLNGRCGMDINQKAPFQGNPVEELPAAEETPAGPDDRGRRAPAAAAGAAAESPEATPHHVQVLGR